MATQPPQTTNRTSEPPKAADATVPTAPALSVEQLQAQIAALKAENASLAEIATRPDAPADASIPSADIAMMAGLGLGGASTVRDERAPVPLHFTHKTPIFNASRPTGRTG
jgi:hypothetical protein